MTDIKWNKHAAARITVTVNTKRYAADPESELREIAARHGLRLSGRQRWTDGVNVFAARVAAGRSDKDTVRIVFLKLADLGHI